MKNISYNNLQFLKDIISTDYKILNYKEDVGLTTTVINNIAQNRNFNFTTEVDPFRCVCDKVPYGSVAKIIVDEEYGIFHMFGRQQRSGAMGSDDRRYFQYNINTGILTRCLPDVKEVSMGYCGGNVTNYKYKSADCCIGLYRHQIHQFYKEKYTTDSVPVQHFIHTGTEFTELENAPSDITDDNGLQAIEYNNKLHLFFTDTTNHIIIHYTWDENNGYVKLSDLPFYLTRNIVFTPSTAIKLFKNKFHFFLAKNDNDSNIHHYTWDESNGTVEVNDTILTMPNSNAEIIQKDNYFIFYYYNDYTYIWDEDNGYVQIPIKEDLFKNTLITNRVAYPNSTLDQRYYQGQLISYRGEIYYPLYYGATQLSNDVYGYHVDSSQSTRYPFVFVKRHNGIWQAIRDINFKENI